MNNEPLSHDDAMVLTGGSLPQHRPDLVALAVAIDDFRDAFNEPAPQPSPELVGWLTGAPAPPFPGTMSLATAATPLATRTSPMRRRIQAAARALAALSVTAKVALGGTAALAAVAAAGAVDVLPEGPQGVYDRIVDNGAGDATVPRTPPDPAAESDLRAGTSDTGSANQPRTEPRSPAPNPVEAPGEDSSEQSQATARDRSDSVGDRPRHPDSTDDSASVHDDRRAGQDEQSDDETVNEPDDGDPDPESADDDGGANEPDDEVSDQPDDASDDESVSGVERGQLGDEQWADSSDSTVDVHEPEEPENVADDTVEGNPT